MTITNIRNKLSKLIQEYKSLKNLTRPSKTNERKKE